MVRQMQLTVALVIAGSMAAGARSSMPPEDRWNPQHIGGLPSEVRGTITPYARICGGPLAAEHSFARYFQNGPWSWLAFILKACAVGHRASVC